MSMDNDTPFPTTRIGWTAVVILCLLYILSMLDRNVMTLLVDQIRADLKITDFQLSLLYGAAFSLFYALGALPIGWAIDELPRRRVIFFCVTLWSAATMSCGFAVNFATMFVSRALVGAGEAVLTPGANSVMADLFPPSRLSLPLSVYFAGAKLGQSLSFLIGSALTLLVAPAAMYSIAGFGLRGWQLIFAIVGLPGFLLAFMIFVIPEPERRHRRVDGVKGHTGYGAYLRYVGRHKRLFGASHFGNLFYLAITTGVISWSPAFFQRVHGLSVTASGVLLGTALLLGPLIGSPVHGWLVDRQFRRGVADAQIRHMIVTGLIALPIGVGAYFVASPLLAAVMIAAFMCLIAGYSGLPAAAVLLFTPGPLRGKAISVLFMINSIAGISAGPTLVAFVTEFVFKDPARVGSAIALMIAIFIPIASASFGLALRPLRNTITEMGMGRRASAA